MSVEAPERIRVAQDSDGFWTCREAISGSQEYVRADKLEELAAEVNGWKIAWESLRKQNEAALAEKDKEIAALREALEDAMAGMRYVRQVYGDLSGVGFDRVEERGRKALARNAGGKDDK